MKFTKAMAAVANESAESVACHRWEYATDVSFILQMLLL